MLVKLSRASCVVLANPTWSNASAMPRRKPLLASSVAVETLAACAFSSASGACAVRDEDRVRCRFLVGVISELDTARFRWFSVIASSMTMGDMARLQCWDVEAKSIADGFSPA